MTFTPPFDESPFYDRRTFEPTPEDEGRFPPPPEDGGQFEPANDDVPPKGKKKRNRPAKPGHNGDLLTENWAARTFAERHAGELLFCHDTGRWHEWTGAAWVPNRGACRKLWRRPQNGLDQLDFQTSLTF